MKKQNAIHRVAALLLAVCLLVSTAPAAFAADGTEEWTVEAQELPGGSGTVASGRKPLVEPEYDDDEIVTVMVQVDAPALLDYYNADAAVMSADVSAGQSVSEFISGMVESGAAKELEDAQAAVMDAVAALSPAPYALMSADSQSTFQVVGQWTTLVNAFALRAPYGMLEAIRNIPGVKNAYVSKTYDVPETPKTDAGDAGYSYDMVGLNAAWSAGYTGKGTVVAVLDTGLDLELSAFYDPNTNENTEDGLEGDNVYAIRRTHEAFRDNSFKSLDADGKADFLASKYKDKAAAVSTIEGLRSVLHATTMGVSFGANLIYKNLKVPFAFDYSSITYGEDGEWVVVGDANVYPGQDGETHGTHVAGTIAGYAEDEDGAVKFSGVAPDAQLLIMKIFPDDGGGAGDPSILYALEDAVALGADMINLSLGGDHGFADDDSIAKAAYQKAFNAGIVMMTSAGNSGYSGTYNNYSDVAYPVENPDMSIMSSPAVYPTNLSVASINNTVETITELTWVKRGAFDYSSGGYTYEENTISYYDPNAVAMKSRFTDDFINRVGQDLRINGEIVKGIPIINAGYGRASYINDYGQQVSDYQNFWSESNLYGVTGIALVKRGMPEGSDQALSFVDKVNNAMAHSGFDANGNPKGVLGVILYDPNDPTDTMLYVSVEGAGMTSISISGEAGEAIAEAAGNYYDPGAYLTSVKQEDTIVTSESGSKMSSFSSWGTGPALELKPEITAPGGNIWSAVFDMTYEGGEGYYDDYDGTYGMMSGTSMAAPHMAGLGAVVKQYVKDKHSDIAPTNSQLGALVNLLLMSTAVPQKPDEGDAYYSPRQQGAGLVNVGAAVTTPAYVTVDGQSVGKIELGDMLDGTFDLEFSVNNMTAKALGYTAQVVVMRPDTQTNDDGKVLVKNTDVVIASKVTGGESITVAANGTAKVTLTVDISDQVDAIDQIFPNGTFIEGYVILTPVGEEGVTIGLPFLGFRGDWTKAPILDTVTWLDGCEEGEQAPEGGWKLDSTSVWDTEGSNTYRYTWFPSLLGFYNGSDFINLGQNVFDSQAPTKQTTYHRENIALSPLGTSLNSFLYINDIELYQIRDARAIVVEVRDKTTGELYWRDYIGCMPRSGFDSGYAAVIPYSVYSFPIWDGTDLNGDYLPNDTECVYTIMAFGDGDYPIVDESGYIDLSGIDLTDKSTWPTFNGHPMDMTGDSISFPVLIDTEAPTLANHAATLTKEGDRVYMTFTVEDNGSLASVEVVPEVIRTPIRTDVDGPETRADDANPFASVMIYDPALKTKTVKVDVTDYVRTHTDYSEDSKYTFEWTGGVYLYIGDYAGNERAYGIRVKDETGEHITDEGLHLSQTSARLHVGSSFTLNVINNTGEALTGDIAYVSDDPSVVSVDASGNVTALRPGQAVVTVTANGGKFSDVCVVAVAENVTEIQDFKLSLESFEGLKSGNQRLTIKVEDIIPADVALDITSGDVRWTVYEEDYDGYLEKLYENGVEGMVTINQGTGDALSGELYLNIATVDGISTLMGSGEEFPGGHGRLEVTIKGVTRTMTFSWEDIYQNNTEDDLVADDSWQTVYVDEGESAELSAKFRVEGHSASDVLFYTADGKTPGDDLYTKELLPDPNHTTAPTGLILEGPSWVANGYGAEPWVGKLVAEEGYKLPEKIFVGTRALSYRGEMEENYYYPYAYTYNSETGELTITQLPYGPDTSLVIRADGVPDENAKGGELSGTTYPGKPEPTYGPFTWTVESGVGGEFGDEDIEGYGGKLSKTFTPAGPGVTYVKATSKDGQYSVRFAVICEPTRAESVALDQRKLEMVIDETTPNPTETLTAILTPSADQISVPEQKELVWTSYNPDVATVDQNGKVTAVAPGYAYILVQVRTNTNLMATCIVHVTKDAAVDAVVGEPAVNAGGIPADKQESITQALTKTLPDAAALEAVASNAAVVPGNAVEAGTEALKNAGITVDTDVRIVAETFLNIDVNGYTETAEEKTLKVDISAAYRLLATTADSDETIEKDNVGGKNAVVLGNTERQLTVNSPITLWVGLPAGFTDEDTILVKHTKNGTHYHKATVSKAEDGTLIATFVSNDGLSPFEFSTANKAVAQIAGTYYATLQEAVDAAKNGDIITVTDPDAKATVSRNLTVTLRGEGDVDTGAMLSAGGYYAKSAVTNEDGSTTYTFTYNYVAPATYSVTVAGARHGAVKANHQTATYGTTVVLTPKADDGYAVETVTVTDAFGHAVNVNRLDDGTYTFLMPSCRVTVEVKFRFACDGGSACVSAPYADLDRSLWYHEAVDYVVRKGLMNGMTPNGFEPGTDTSRAMLVTILWRQEGKPAVDFLMTFSDVPSDQWYTEAIRWAASEGIVDGYPDGSFMPDKALSRQEAAAILYRYAQKKGYDMTAQSDFAGYTDAETIQSWALASMKWAVGTGLIYGDTPTTLSPASSATRAQIAAILMRFCVEIAK